MYEEKNPFISIVVEPNVGASEKDTKIADVEATVKTATDVASSEVEKGMMTRQEIVSSLKDTCVMLNE